MQRQVLAASALGLIIACTFIVACGGGDQSVSPTGPGTDAVGGTCNFTIARDQTNKTIDAAGGELTVPVSVTAGCTWKAESQSDFISIAERGTTSGSGSVKLNVLPNSQGQRQGKVTIAGVEFTITQQAAPCRFTVMAESTRFDASGGFGKVVVAVVQGGTNCQWTATTDAPFISNVAPANGTGNGTVTFAVQTNTGSGRSGTLRIAGETVTITQDAVVPAGSVPQILRVSPASVPASTFLMTITGQNFDSGAVDRIYFQGALVGAGVIQSRSGTEIIVRQMTTGAQPGTYQVRVLNGNGQLSAPVNFEITAPSAGVPLITSVSPASVPASTFTMTITGQNFDSGAVDRIYFQDVLVGAGVIQSRSATEIVVRQMMTGAQPGTYQVRVLNGNGQLSAPVNFEITR